MEQPLLNKIGIFTLKRNYTRTRAWMWHSMDATIMATGTPQTSGTLVINLSCGINGLETVARTEDHWLFPSQAWKSNLNAKKKNLVSVIGWLWFESWPLVAWNTHRVCVSARPKSQQEEETEKALWCDMGGAFSSSPFLGQAHVLSSNESFFRCFETRFFGHTSWQG